MTPSQRRQIASAYADLQGIDWPMICEWAIMEWGYDEAKASLEEARRRTVDDENKGDR